MDPTRSVRRNDGASFLLGTTQTPCSWRRSQRTDGSDHRHFGGPTSYEEEFQKAIKLLQRSSSPPSKSWLSAAHFMEIKWAFPEALSCTALVWIWDTVTFWLEWWGKMSDDLPSVALSLILSAPHVGHDYFFFIVLSQQKLVLVPQSWFDLWRKRLKGLKRTLRLVSTVGSESRWPRTVDVICSRSYIVLPLTFLRFSCSRQLFLLVNIVH